MLPEHEVLIVDEAHELVSRVTGVATGELTPGQVNRAVRRAAKLVNEKAADALQTAAEGFERLMELALPGRLEELPEDLALRADGAARRRPHGDLRARRDPRQVRPGRGRGRASRPWPPWRPSTRSPSGSSTGSEYDVVWYERHDRFGASLRVAPLSRLRAAAGEALHGPLRRPDLGHAQARRRLQRRRRPRSASPPRADRTGRGPCRSWKGVDVGSPFDYPKQGILYVAKHLSPPRRDGDRDDMLDELAELIEAAGGRTLGLFSSMRAAQPAAEELRGRTRPTRSCCQGEETLGELIRRFAADAGDLPVRHPLALAGRRCARAQLPVGGHGPDPVPAPGRPADERPPEGGGGARRQRLHGGRRHARRAAHGAGRRPAGAGLRGPRRGRRARPPAGHGPLRRLPQGLDAGLLVHDGPQPGAAVAGGHRRCGSANGEPGRRTGTPETRYDGTGRNEHGPRRPAQWSRGPVRGGSAAQTRRSTATTLPRMVASSPGMGWYAELCGSSHTWPSSRLKRLTVASPSSIAATMSPFSATG